MQQEWDTEPCNLTAVFRRFECAYYLHRQDDYLVLISAVLLFLPPHVHKIHIR